MAAAEYYSGAPMSSTSHLAPPRHQAQQHPHPQQSAGGLPYPISDAPPPYTAYAEPSRPQSQPPPQHRPAPSGGPYHPDQTPHPQYPPEKNGSAHPAGIQNMFRPQDFNPAYHPQPPPSQQHLSPPGAPTAMQQAYSNSQRPSSTPAYGRPQDSYEDRSRSRSHSRSRRHRHRHDRPPMERKRSSGVKTFLGAGGGAIIGDAIFPGLGTLGGAILGGIGGHEYGKKHRSHSHPHRTRERSYSNDDDAYYDNGYRRGRKY